jgi:hypothetical protein
MRLLLLFAIGVAIGYAVRLLLLLLLCDAIDTAIDYAVRLLLLFHCGAVGHASGDNDEFTIMLILNSY